MKLHTTDKPGILFFVMPFASAASYKHAGKLLSCLAPVAERIFVVGDERLDLSGQRNVIRASKVPTMHYLKDKSPLPWSAFLWVMKLMLVMLKATWAVVKTRRQTDVVFCFQGIYYAPVLLCARLLGKKTVSFEPGNDVANATIAYEGKRGSRLIVGAMSLMRRSTRALSDVCAIESLRLVETSGLAGYREKVRVANLYVDTEIYHVTAPFAERANTVGFIGRMSTGKGIRPLLEAAESMHGSGVRFVFVGDGPLRETVEAGLTRPELSHAELLPWAGEAAVVNVLNRCRLVVLPSDTEGLPNVLLEAMSCGTAVLATPVGGIPDLVRHGITGFLLVDRDPATIATAIAEALADPNLERIAEQGRADVTHEYSLVASSRKWEAIFVELLATPAPVMKEAEAR